MEQANISIRTDADLKRDFERLCQDIGMNMSTAFNIFMKKSIRENRIPLELTGDPAYDEVTTAVPGRAVTKEELLEGVRELDAGFGIEMTMEELRALERELLEKGPVCREIERRREEMRARKRAWEAQENG